MRSLSAVVLPLALAGVGVGCASGMSPVPGGAGADPSAATEVESEEPVAASPPPRPTEPGRRRLSQTVTLGQGATEPAYAPGLASQGGGAGASVTVNNNVTVVNQPPVFYGGYGGVGYGAYGASGTRDGRGGAGSRSAWAPSGWEGAQRTAPPGSTPGVGGNWAPAPSFGPASLR
jgi:hypothetical protein